MTINVNNVGNSDRIPDLNVDSNNGQKNNTEASIWVKEDVGESGVFDQADFDAIQWGKYQEVKESFVWAL